MLISNEKNQNDNYDIESLKEESPNEEDTMKNKRSIVICGFSLEKFSEKIQLTICIIGLFFFYILQGVLQVI
jgi:hypothetical protein